MKTTKELTAIFGTGKSLRNRETTTIAAGTEVSPIGFENGLYFFNALEYGRQCRYAVETEAEFKTAVEG